MNIASLGNEAICDGQRSYMRWASKLYSFFCLFFVGCGVWGTDYL